MNEFLELDEIYFEMQSIFFSSVVSVDVYKNSIVI